MTISYVNVPKAPVETFPRQLFFGNRQGGFYDPSDRSTLFQDTAGTIPVTADGQPVALMLDKSGRGNHLVQAVLAARPIYRTNGILHWLEFDGSDDMMQSNTLVQVTGPGLVIAGGFQSDVNAGGSLSSAFGIQAALQTDCVNFRLRPNSAAASHSFVASRQSSGATYTASLNGLLDKTTRFAINAVFETPSNWRVFENGQLLVASEGSGFAGLLSPRAITLGMGNLALRFYGGMILLHQPSVSEMALVSNLYMKKVGIIA